jgi:hypothetical protein
MYKSGEKMKELGYLYVLANSAMPNMVKVGKTTRSSSERAEELSRATGLPTPFIVVYEHLFADCGAAESFVHAYLEAKGYRVANNREFFNAPASIVVKAISLAPSPIDDELLLPELEEENDLLRQGEPDKLDDLGFDKLKPAYPWTDIFEEAEAHYYGLDDCIQDYAEAMRLFKQAAKLGALPAYGRIGNMYKDGKGVFQDKNKALEFYKEGARKGSVYCYWAMAVLFRAEGNENNAEKCFSLFLKNKPEKVPDEQYFTSDELMDVLFVCNTLLYFKVIYGEEFPDILKGYMIENLSAITEITKNCIESCLENNRLEQAQNYKLTLQYLDSFDTQAVLSKCIHNEDGLVFISLDDSNISLPENLYNQVAALVTEGKTLLAASLISKTINEISLTSAKDIAQAIYKYQQLAGIRQ